MKTTGHFFINSRSFLLRLRNVSDKIIEEMKTRIFSSISCFGKSSRLWDNVEKVL